jgi:acyl-CoA synthetase (AMP-forming)/AMP-acid ligase II
MPLDGPAVSVGGAPGKAQAMTAMTLVDLVCRSGCTGPAIAGPDGATLDHVALCNAADAIGSALAARGVEPGDRVACSLPEGAAFAATLIGAAAIRAALVPLPPVAEEASARGLLRGRTIRAVVIAPGAPAALRAAAAAQGIPALTVGFDDRGRALVDGEHVYDAHARIAEPDDVAFVPPAGEPLTQRDLVAAAGERGLDGLLDAVQAATIPVRQAA